MDKKPIKSRALTEEVKIYLNKYIRTLDLKKNNKLPSEELLAELIGVSRITIRGALNELASEGIIFRKQGKGTFVNLEALQIKVKFTPVQRFKDMIVKSGYIPGVKMTSVKIQKAGKYIAEKLGIEEDREIVVTKKVFYADNNPCAYCVDYFERSLIGSRDIDEIKKYENSIFEYIHQVSHRKVMWDKVEIETKTTLESPELAQAFKCEGDKIKSVLLLKGIDFDQDDEPMLYAKEYIDTDFIKFNMIRQRNINYEESGF